MNLLKMRDLGDFDGVSASPTISVAGRDPVRVLAGGFKGKGTDPSGKTYGCSRAFYRYVGKDAERSMAVCCESCLDNKNVSKHTPMSHSDRPMSGRLFFALHRIARLMTE
jgi:hypothetical protein